MIDRRNFDVSYVPIKFFKSLQQNPQKNKNFTINTSKLYIHNLIATFLFETTGKQKDMIVETKIEQII